MSIQSRMYLLRSPRNINYFSHSSCLDQTVNTNILLQWIVLLVKQLPHTDHQLRDQLLKAGQQYEHIISDLFWDKTRKVDGNYNHPFENVSSISFKDNVLVV